MALMPFDQARALILATAARHRTDSEHVDLASALSRVLANEMRAPFSVPGFRHSAMDGFAIAIDQTLELRDEQLIEFTQVGQTLAGDQAFGTFAANEAIAIATGAIVPDHVTHVVPIESSERLAADRVRLKIAPSSPSHIRGADDDYADGDPALAAGTTIGFAALGVLASFGASTVVVARQPRVSVVVTGSELVPVGAVRRPGQIHDSNGSSLRGLLQREGLNPQLTAVVDDDESRLRDHLLAACAQSDVVISTGGASAGVADFMPRLLAELGEVIVWKIAMRPGMPLLFGRIGNTLVFGLPGNPVAVVAGFLALVQPVLRTMQGAAPSAPIHARLDQPTSKRHDRLEFRRASLHIDAQGVARVTPHPALSSGVLRSVVQSNALILLAADRFDWQLDEVVEVLCYVWNL